jgi:maleamate amidohydrolase
MTNTRASDTALIVVDGINDFYSPEGQTYYPSVEGTIEPIQSLLAAARAADVLIVHATEQHRPGLDDGEWSKLPQHNLAGSFDAQIFPAFVTATPSHREIVVGKRRYSAFFQTDLALLLAENGIRTVVIAGVKTNVCVRATATDAFGWGLRVVVPREATNSNRPHLGQASLEDIDRYIGNVCGTADAAKLLSGHPAPAALTPPAEAEA